MKWIKRLSKCMMLVVSVIVLYGIVALLCSYITIGKATSKTAHFSTIYLHSNGVHLDVVLPLQQLNESTLAGLKYTASDQYLSFGWGDENFYINTPTWGDLTVNNAFSALFLKSPTLLHLTRYTAPEKDWIPITVNEQQFNALEAYLQSSFQQNTAQQKMWLPNQGYGDTDDFYKAKGSYSCFKTCNTWVNIGFKQSNLKACLWTPFDFGLLQCYQK